MPAGEGSGINQAGLLSASVAGVEGKLRWLAKRTLPLRGREARNVVEATLVDTQVRRVSDGGSIPPASTISTHEKTRSGGFLRIGERRNVCRV